MATYRKNILDFIESAKKKKTERHERIRNNLDMMAERNEQVRSNIDKMTVKQHKEEMLKSSYSNSQLPLQMNYQKPPLKTCRENTIEHSEQTQTPAKTESNPDLERIMNKSTELEKEWRAISPKGNQIPSHLT